MQDQDDISRRDGASAAGARRGVRALRRAVSRTPRRFYRLRLFFRIKGETPGMSAGAGMERLQRSVPDSRLVREQRPGDCAGAVARPLRQNVLKSAKPNSSFAVPPSLMNAMQGTSLTGLSSGTPPAAGAAESA